MTFQLSSFHHLHCDVKEDFHECPRRHCHAILWTSQSNCQKNGSFFRSVFFRETRRSLWRHKEVSCQRFFSRLFPSCLGLGRPDIIQWKISFISATSPTGMSRFECCGQPSGHLQGAFVSQDIMEAGGLGHLSRPRSYRGHGKTFGSSLQAKQSRQQQSSSTRSFRPFLCLCLLDLVSISNKRYQSNLIMTTCYFLSAQ